ncbi:hypothetical protein C8R47DRAFT_1202133 [Mycena vitilis]|nr:hypothetical protein C8R47DRAFT_1202133 [Mycena vitilis]
MSSPRVRAIAMWKSKTSGSNEEIKAQGEKIVAHIKSLDCLTKNLLKYDVSRKHETLPTTLAADLGLKDTEFTTVIIIEAETHEKIREALTHPDYLAVVKGALDHATTLENFHFFSAEYVTIIDK